jgi:hypothetical protein
MFKEITVEIAVKKSNKKCGKKILTNNLEDDKIKFAA